MNIGVYDVADLSPRMGTGLWCVLLYARVLPLAITLGVAIGGCATAVDGSGSYEMTELHKVAERNDVQTITKWFAKGKSPDGVYNERGNWHEGAGIHGKTALMFAAERGHFESAKLLVEGGANIYLEAGKPNRDDKRSAFDYAVEGGNPEIVSLLWEKSDKQRFRKNARINLVVAYRRLCSSSSDLEPRRRLVHFLLDHVTDVRTASEELATISGYERCLPEIQLLLERGVKPSTSALNYAAASEQIDLVALYLKHGAKVNALGRDPMGGGPVTPLIAASGNAQPKIVEMLLRAGADPNGRDNYGKSALMVVLWGACPTRPNPYCEKRMMALDILLKNGAQKDVRDSNGKSAVDYVGMFGASDAYLEQKKVLLGLSTLTATQAVPVCAYCKVSRASDISPSELRLKIWSFYKSVRNYHDRGAVISRSQIDATLRFETYYSREHGLKLTWTEELGPSSTVPATLRKRYDRSHVLWGNPNCLQRYLQSSVDKIVYGCRTFKDYWQGCDSTSFQSLVTRYIYGQPEDCPVYPSSNETVEIHVLPDRSKAYVLVTELSDRQTTRLWLDPRQFYIKRFDYARWKPAPDSPFETTIDIESVDSDRLVTTEMVSFEPPVWKKTGLDQLDEGVRAFYFEEYAKAVSLLAPLARKNRPEAMYFLAQMYAGGKGVNQNWNQAYALMKKAAANGYKPAHAGLVGLMQFGFLIDEVKDMPAEALKQEYYAQLKAALEYERCNTDLFKAVEQFIETNKEYEADWGRWQKQKAGCSWSSLDSYTSPLSVTDLSDFRATPRVEVRNNPGESDPFTRRWFERYDDAASTRSLS